MRFFFTLTLLVFCLSPLSHAVALTDDIQQRYAQTTSFSANFEQTLTHKESGAIEKRRGVLLFQKPLLIRWTTEKPHTEILVATRQESGIICRMKKLYTNTRSTCSRIPVESFRCLQDRRR